MRPRLRILPGKAWQFIADRHIHQLVIGRVIIHLIDAHTVAVEGFKLGRMAVGESGLFEYLGRTGEGTARGQFLFSPAATFPMDTLAKRYVTLPQVLVFKVWRHIGDFMGRQRGQWFYRYHFIFT